MVLKKILRYLLIGIVAIFVLLVIFLAFSLAPVDRTPAHLHTSYQVMMAELKQLDSVVIPPATTGFSVGYAKVNLTPAAPMATGGYGKRMGKPYTAVHDSIYVRTLVVSNGARKIAIVSADLIIIPPAVTERLQHRLAGTGFNLGNVYLGATHTHNSIGHWGEGAARFLYGAYRDTVVDYIAGKIVASIRQAAQAPLAAELRTAFIPVPEAVDNRLIDGGPEDSLLRVVEVRRSDSSKLVLMTLNAHATCMSSKDITLSRDYPGVLVDALEAQGYTFAMFMAGAVGSHSYTYPPAGMDCRDWMGKIVSETFLSQRHQLRKVEDHTLAMVRIPLPLSDPQVKITPTWKVRAWLFRAAFGEYPVYLTALRLGDMVMLGTPCDFSGEFTPRLDSIASAKGLTTIVTSFNGGYIGYVTPMNRYDIDHYETQFMNWYAPGTGEYIEQCLERLVEVMGK